MKTKIFIFALVIVTMLIWWNRGPSLGNGLIEDVNPISFSQDMLHAVRTDGDTAAYLDTLANINLKYLAEQLNTDSRKLAFWLNIYNSLTQVILKRDSALADTRFYSKDLIELGKTRISLDIIEHGILRKFQMKYGFGYVSNWFPSKFEKMFALENTEPRIHFALNCGAASCPPIAFYKPELINEQLDIATRGYLETNASYDLRQNVIHAPEIMSWFRGDFGGKTGVIAFLQRYDVAPGIEDPTLEFDRFDWTLKLNNYKDDAVPE